MTIQDVLNKRRGSDDHLPGTPSSPKPTAEQQAEFRRKLEETARELKGVPLSGERKSAMDEAMRRHMRKYNSAT
jgi:hypothetical protein